MSGNNRNNTLGRYFKSIVIFAGSLAGLLSLLYIAMWVLIYMGLTGVWPFSPLERITEEIVLEIPVLKHGRFQPIMNGNCTSGPSSRGRVHAPRLSYCVSQQPFCA